MFFAYYIFIGLVGLLIGSFLNVIILRLPENKKITGRSICPKCQKKLKWYHLIPLFSFIFLKGKCSKCKEKISWQYPLVELSTALIFVFSLWQFNIINNSLWSISSIINFSFFIIFASILIVIFVTDLKFYIVPNEVIYPAIFIAFIYQIFNALIGSKMLILESVLSGLGAGLFFLWLVVLTRGKGMGIGDIKIAIFMGLLLAWPNILVALFISFLSGTVIGLFLVVIKRKSLKSEVPFGCFLAPATFIAFFWGAQIINWYFQLIY
jgi:prepilin signal peptidase PulO-like enzyme (type II secretory pathway)